MINSITQTDEHFILPITTSFTNNALKEESSFIKLIKI